MNIRGKATTLINHPLRYDGSVPAFRGVPLEPGADSLELLAELGYSADEQRRLVDGGIVGAAQKEVA